MLPPDLTADFHDRLKRIIDHIIETRDISGPAITAEVLLVLCAAILKGSSIDYQKYIANRLNNEAVTQLLNEIHEYLIGKMVDTSMKDIGL